MPYLFLFFLLLTPLLLPGQQVPVRIVYENEDAYNNLQRSPYMARYMKSRNGVEWIRGKERSSLYLYQQAGIFTTDSVYVEFPGRSTKAWRYTIVSIRNYETNGAYSVYMNLPQGFAYAEDCPELQWKVDKSRTKNILGMRCYYATVTFEEVKHQIWFTNELPYKDGPMHSRKRYHCHLPGLVLEHIMGDGNVCRAVDISFVDAPADVEKNLSQLQVWEKDDRPSYPPENPDASDFLLIDKTFPVDSWIPLFYTPEVRKTWLPK